MVRCSFYLICIYDEYALSSNLEKSFLITCPGRDLGFFYWVVNASRCKRLQENAEDTFMAEAVLSLSPSLHLSPSLMCIQGTHNNYIKHLFFYVSTCALEALNPQVDLGTRQPILNLCMFSSLLYCNLL